MDIEFIICVQRIPGKYSTNSLLKYMGYLIEVVKDLQKKKYAENNNEMIQVLYIQIWRFRFVVKNLRHIFRSAVIGDRQYK